MMRDPYSCWPTRREESRMAAAARKRSQAAAVKRSMRRAAVIRHAIQRLEEPNHFPHGPEFGWGAREHARIERMMHAMQIEEFSRGHARGYEYAQTVEPRSRAAWELDAARKREAVA